MDSSLRMNLSDALSDGLDAQIIAGTNGLLTGTNLAHQQRLGRSPATRCIGRNLATAELMAGTRPPSAT